MIRILFTIYGDELRNTIDQQVCVTFQQSLKYIEYLGQPYNAAFIVPQERLAEACNFVLEQWRATRKSADGVANDFKFEVYS